MMRIASTTLATPVGELLLLANEEALLALEFADEPRRLESARARLERALGPLDVRAGRDPAGAATRLRRYFDGDLGALAEQPVELHGTAFQCTVWEALRTIPPGRTWSYARLAVAVGAPRAVRAAGAANGSNTLALVVPCHRVIASDGSLGGYGGGLERKRWLLAHEGVEAFAGPMLAL